MENGKIIHVGGGSSGGTGRGASASGMGKGGGSSYSIDLASCMSHTSKTAIAQSNLNNAAPALLQALDGIMAIVNDSRGVAGFHLNGNTALWEELEEIDAALAAIAAARGE